MPRITSKLYWGSLRLGLILGVAGWIVAMVGALARKQPLLRAGMAAFFALFSIWGLANGGAMVWAFSKHLRRHGLKATIRDIASHPWSSALYSALTIVFLFAGLTMLYMVLKELSIIR